METHTELFGDLKPQSERGAFPFAIVWHGLLRSWPVLVAVAVISVGATVLWLKYDTTPSYTIKMTVAPYVDPSAANRSPAPSAAGGLRSLLGGIGGQNQSNFQLYLDTRLSVALAARLIQVEEVRSHIFYHEWNSTTQQWRAPSGWMVNVRANFRSWLGMPSWSPPTAADLAEILGRSVVMDTDRDRTHFTYIYQSQYPDFGSWLLDAIHTESEAMLRSDARQRTITKIDHLNGLVPTVTTTENRLALVEDLAEEQRNLMLINPKLPYASIVVDPPSVSHYPTSPKITLDILLGMVLAEIIVGGLLTLRIVRNFRRSNRQVPSRFALDQTLAEHGAE